ncbi:MAG: S24 family peptidase [Armatimonadota bacterium]
MTTQIVTDHALNGNPSVIGVTKLPIQTDNIGSPYPPIHLPQQRIQDRSIELCCIKTAPKDVRIFAIYDTLAQEYRGIVHTDNLTFDNEEAREAFFNEVNDVITHHCQDVTLEFTQQRIRIPVTDDAMITDGIMPGGDVLVHLQDFIEDNYIYVIHFKTDDVTTIRRVRHLAKGQLKLIPSNPAMCAQICQEDEIDILGEVIEARFKVR